MKPIAFHLSTPEAKANCISHITLLDVGDNYVVNIKSAKESRSGAQQRLRWLWFTQMAKELSGVGKGRNKDQWNLYYKHKYVPSILIAQDEDYAVYFSDYKDTCLLLKGEEKKRYQKLFWDRVIRTKDMNVKSFGQWLDLVEHDAREDKKVILHIPDDLKWVRN